MSAHVRIGVGTEQYAVDLDHVREVTTVGPVVQVPGAGPLVDGVFQLRGEILPVIRLGDLLGAPPGQARRLLVVRDGDRCAALAVDQANAVEDLPEPEAPSEPMMRGSVLLDGTILGILDVPAVLDAVSAVS